MEFISINLLALGIISFVIYIWITIYNNKRGPQNQKGPNPPEPRGAWPVVGHLHLLGRARKPAARTLGAMADEHGPIFTLRLGSGRALVVSCWEAVKDCFTTNDKVFASRPSIAMGKNFYNYAVFALSPYGPYWRDVRKLATVELFTHHRLRQLKHVWDSEVNYHLKDLYLRFASSNRSPSPVEVRMNKWFEELTMDITIRLLAGKRLSGQDQTLKELMKSMLYLGGAFVPSDAIPSIGWMDLGGYLRSMRRTFRGMDRVLAQWLDEHKLKKKSRGVGDGDCDDDFMDVMLSTIPEDCLVSGYNRDTVIKATVLILVMTGSESTGETLTWALSLMLNNRHVLRRAQKELDTHVGKDRWTEESDIPNLPYLQAVIKETLRLYPPGPLSGPRLAMEDCHVGGYFVPRGTRLIVNLWKLHRDPRVWSEPLEFRPERFLGTDHAHVTFKGQNHEYIPFSSGRRMCPAVSFAHVVVHLALARLLQGFDLSTPGDAPVDMSEGVGIALPKIKPLEVLLSPRLDAPLYQNL